MQEIREITDWIASQETAFHRIPEVSSLPNPEFECEGKKMVSFSSNNYLALAHDPRMIAAAREGLEKYGVANCESRLLGGDMEVYLGLEKKLAALKDKESAMLYATGYLTNLGVLSALPRSGMLPRVYGFRPSKRLRYDFFSDESNHTSIREVIAL
jgi:7-keto-8-aminopelargonate synthetase-like enzyme